MVGARFADTWRIYHDTLAQMILPECKQWMAREGYLKRWILQTNDINSGTVYEGRPVGTWNPAGWIYSSYEQRRYIYIYI